MRTAFTFIGGAIGVGGLSLFVATLHCLQPTPLDLGQYTSQIARNTYVDRSGEALNITYGNTWNLYHRVKLHDVPLLVQQAFVVAEDKRFYDHDGIDWHARLSALWQNVKARQSVRGASTISEQVIKMLNPRPRTVWTRWLEGFEAMALERAHSKPAILEFYLNQVPYRARRRGIVQAARFYFDRDVETLNDKEMLALAIMVRAPRWLDPHKQTPHFDDVIEALANRMHSLNLLDKTTFAIQSFSTTTATDSYNFSHFLEFADRRVNHLAQSSDVIHTTIDRHLQQTTQQILDRRLRDLAARHVQNAAALIVDHRTNEIRSWVVGRAGDEAKAFNKVNAVLVQRQPGSALKPLLYSAAIQHGWTAATLIDDSPLAEGVGLGMHAYQNYSRVHYGPVSLREALGNSLNIPAIKAVQFVGPERFLAFLWDIGFKGLRGHPNIYGDGLALGNGEVNLYELVQAYTVLARMGEFKPLSFLDGDSPVAEGYRVLSEDIASLIADIMSDPNAREKEFGKHSVLNFPFQTAVKTGTSSDYRDAWALGFNDQYTVGVWMGNMDYSPMGEVTGSTGPALTLRTIFSELNRHRQVHGLFLSDKLLKKTICIESGGITDHTCDAKDEWFIPGTSPRGLSPTDSDVRLRKPSKGLQLAMDPRIPDDHEYFQFTLSNVTALKRVTWYVNDELVAVTDTPRFDWKLARGAFRARAEIETHAQQGTLTTATVNYRVR